MKKEKFEKDMDFLHKAYALGKRHAENYLSKIQQSNISVKKHELINSKVWIEGLIEAAEFMVDAEKRTVTIYRDFHKLNG